MLANLIAWPAVFWVMSDWLSGFPYRVDINPWVFVAGSLMGLGYFGGYHWLGALKSAEENPVRALRYE
jgi:putative ABC transport system permease protein